MYIQFFGKKQAGKDVPKMCRRINQQFLRLQFTCSPTVRSLFRRRAGKGVPAKAFLLFRTTVTLVPLGKR